MKARLIVKGNKFQAAKAAADRGLPFVFENEADTPISTAPIDDDPTRFCNACGSYSKGDCHCGPTAEND